MPDVGSYLIIGIIAAVVTFVATPLVTKLANRLGWVAMPNARSVHTEPLPDVGGLAMFIGFAVALGVAWAISDFSLLFESNSEPLGVLIAAAIVFGVGLVDDVREVSAPAKIFFTVMAGLALVWFGVVMFYFRVPYLDAVILSDDLKPLITVLWLVGMTQAINLIDGLDGLAAGVVAIGAGAFFLYSQELTDRGFIGGGNIGPLFAIIAVGVCLGFLPHNFNPARIIMGDGGALLLGLLLAVSTSVVGGRADPFQTQFVGTTYFFLAPIAIPLLILGVPIFDTMFAILRRATSRKSLASADKGHLHHRLINLGHGHRRSVLILWSWTALLSGFVLYPTLTDQNPTYLPFGVAALGIALFTMLHPSVIQQRRDNNTPPHGIELETPPDDPDQPTLFDDADTGLTTGVDDH
ncbi:glycosyltransferase family 4 protein [Ilumatobacter coccineus]|uniref:UDP-N-acetylglucosamine--undecaprenyl-phosphate N-acetylglucosamine-1-phosphate transferase n=1 Tax=Ilumatobacter coccineus (strain NBRC 103263 / KCTC 29153 / YM16-304) TaxID=1313172 RepID=A0A6C7E3W0_ILUCY|nr:MraY family glycosyltransferase [Ilumatobacter coccineus]BAN01370.1 UDP-N-acetylglucosamine--undecaprenyl-phosphate N-acetylglucosamine-1-phosphate transferase [Ilumatobacter coccineus YM16-304]